MTASERAARELLQVIMQTLGPHAPTCCPGCHSEIALVLDKIRTFGIDYLPRGSAVKRVTVQRDSLHRRLREREEQQ